MKKKYSNDAMIFNLYVIYVRHLFIFCSKQNIPFLTACQKTNIIKDRINGKKEPHN